MSLDEQQYFIIKDKELPGRPGCPWGPLSPLGPSIALPGSPGRPWFPLGPGGPAYPGSPFRPGIPGIPGDPGKPTSPFAPRIWNNHRTWLERRSQSLKPSALSSTRSKLYSFWKHFIHFYKNAKLQENYYSSHCDIKYDEISLTDIPFLI